MNLNPMFQELLSAAWSYIADLLSQLALAYESEPNPDEAQKAKDAADEASASADDAGAAVVVDDDGDAQEAIANIHRHHKKTIPATPPAPPSSPTPPAATK